MYFFRQLLVSTISLSLLSISVVNAKNETEPVLKKDKSELWVDSVMSNMNLREKIAQLVMVAAYSNKPQSHTDATRKLVEEQKIGGLIFFQGSPTKQAELTNYYQSRSKVPLFIAMDAEWGPAMRLDSVMAFPRQMMLGAVADNRLVYEMGRQVAYQCKLLGVHINFAPVVDVNNNPANPVIKTRSFGEVPHQVAEKGIAYMQGLQENGVMACAKHFPGHGDTDKDSHGELPVLLHDDDRLDSVEFYPFRRLINEGVQGVMVAHLSLPTIEGSSGLPSSLSDKIINRYLRRKLDFKGLVFTDALNMKAVKKSVGANQNVSVQALIAGNDVLVMPEDIPATLDAIEKAIEDGRLSKRAIENKCEKILLAKYNAGLWNYKPINLKNLSAQLNSLDALATRNKLIESAITLLKNDNEMLPLQRLDTTRIAYVSIEGGADNEFTNQLALYGPFSSYSVPQNLVQRQADLLLTSLDSFNLVIVGYHSTKRAVLNNKIIDDFLSKLNQKTSVVLSFFGSPYELVKLSNPRAYNSLILAYDNEPETQNRVAQLIYGGIVAKGTLSVSVDTLFSEGYGLKTPKVTRLHYALPEEVGLSTASFNPVDSMIKSALAQKAMPGCQVLVAYKGNVIYHKAFGRFTNQSSSQVVRLSDIYDVASVTKVSATLPLVMKMKDKGDLTLDHKLGDFISFEKYATNKSNLKIKDVLLHQSGLQAFIPFYQLYLRAPKDEKVFSMTSSPVYSLQIPTDRRYLNKNYFLDTADFTIEQTPRTPVVITDSLFGSLNTLKFIQKGIDSSRLLSKNYRYSDLGFMYLQRVLESKYQKREDVLANDWLYKPLGMNRTTFCPTNKFDRKEIVPTEIDAVFRRQLVHGYVNDPTAAMLGGVSGHAGVFSTANDMAKLMQMYLNRGSYGGEQLIDSLTIDEFTTCQNCDGGNRRGLGFDKPEPNPQKNSPICKEASLQSYGHTGYTGTMVWMDPTRDLLFIFFSNRVYPTPDNTTLIKLSTRTNIFAELINIIEKKQKEDKKQAEGKIASK